jgi:hypothetical protein
MITIETDILIPEAWHELSMPQAVDTLNLLEGFFKQEYDISEFRLLLLKNLTGYKPDKKKYKTEEFEQITFNLFILSEMLTFPLKPYYHNPELLEVLSEGLQQKLQTTLPIDISDYKEKAELNKIISMLKWEPVINLDIRKNIVPIINGIAGPVFDIDEYGVVTTNMIAAEYIDAYDFFNLYRQTRAEKYMNCFVSALYRKDRSQYSTYETQQNAPRFLTVPMPVKNAVYVWFQGFLDYLYERSDFTWLFNRLGNDSGVSLGLSNTVNQLAASGYGSTKEVAMYPLQDYLTLQKKELIDAIRNMKNMDMKMHEIEQKTGLSGDIIVQI